VPRRAAAAQALRAPRSPGSRAARSAPSLAALRGAGGKPRKEPRGRQAEQRAPRPAHQLHSRTRGVPSPADYATPTRHARLRRAAATQGRARWAGTARGEPLRASPPATRAPAAGKELVGGPCLAMTPHAHTPAPRPLGALGPPATLGRTLQGSHRLDLFSSLSSFFLFLFLSKLRCLLTLFFPPLLRGSGPATRDNPLGSPTSDQAVLHDLMILEPLGNVPACLRGRYGPARLRPRASHSGLPTSLRSCRAGDLGPASWPLDPQCFPQYNGKNRGVPHRLWVNP
jgi:hypothetical protein